MLKGNISNRQAPVIAFNLDHLLFNNVRKNDLGVLKLAKLYLFPDKKDEYFSREINSSFVDIVNNTWYNYEFSIYLLTATNFQAEIEDLLYEYDVCYTRLQHYTGLANLRRLVEYRYYLYVDNDAETISTVGFKNAIHINDLSNHFSISRG